MNSEDFAKRLMWYVQRSYEPKADIPRLAHELRNEMAGIALGPLVLVQHAKGETLVRVSTELGHELNKAIREAEHGSRIRPTPVPANERIANGFEGHSANRWGLPAGVRLRFPWPRKKTTTSSR